MAITTLNNRAINRSDTASADQVWTATSATASDFQAAASGSHTLLSTSTVSSAVSEVDISSNIDSTYKSYMIDILNFSPATNGVELRVRFFQGGSVDTGSVYDSHQYQMNADDGSGPTSYKNTNDKASGKQKLKDLGLNDDEIKALTGA